MLWLLLAAGCRKEQDDSTHESVVAPHEAVELGEQKTCESPVPEGPGRFTEEGAARGLSMDRPAFWGDYTSFDGSLVATDLEGDGDPDLLLGRVEGAPDTFVNDGTGQTSFLVMCWIAFPPSPPPEPPIWMGTGCPRS
jgi:hypothetical protein